MSGVNQRERGGNRRGNRRSAPSGGFRNNRIQQQLPQQLIHASFSHDSCSNYVTISGNQQPFVGQLTHPSIINGRPNMNVPPHTLTYPFLPQNIQPNGTPVAYIAQPQYLSNQSSGMRYNGTYQSFLPALTIPQNNQSLSGSQGTIPIQSFQSYHNNQPYTSNIQGVPLSQQYSSNHATYSNTPPSYGTIQPVPNFQHLQSIVAFHSLPSIIPPFPGMVSQNVVPLNGPIIHPITTALHTIPQDPNDITTLGGVQFSTPGKNTEKKDEVKREKREKVPLKILDPNTNEEIIDTPPEVKTKFDDTPEIPIVNTDNFPPKMFVIHSPVMVQNPVLLSNQQLISQSPIIHNGIHPIHFPIDSHQIIPNRHYVPSSQFQRNQSSINYLDAAIGNFYSRELGSRNGVINNNNTTNSLSGEEITREKTNDSEVRRNVIPQTNNIDSNNNNSIIDLSDSSSNSNTQESTKNLFYTNSNNNKYKKAGIVGSTIATQYCTNEFPNNLNDYTEKENDKNSSIPDTYKCCNGIKNKKIKKYKNNMRDSGLSYSSPSNLSNFKGKHISFKSISSTNGKRNLSLSKEKYSPSKNKQSFGNEDSSKFKIQNLLAYNFEALTIRNVSLVREKNEISFISGNSLNTSFKKAVNEIFSLSHNEMLSNDNRYNNSTPVNLMEQLSTLNEDSKKDDCIASVLDDNTVNNEDGSNKNINCPEKVEEADNEYKSKKLLLDSNDKTNSLQCLEECGSRTFDIQPGPSNITPSDGILHSKVTTVNKMEEDIKNTEEEVNHEQRKRKDKKNKGQNKGYGDKYNNHNRKKR
uniref:MI domain-containing protein n=1 Tax=Strongyloides papillosus TaxID=174720 RepID=A0A0N5CH06_STREA